MRLIKSDKYKKIEAALLVAFVCGSYLVLNFIAMTDGDDAYFSKMANSMRFFDYLRMRYNEWEGRMTSEAMAYIAFYFGKNFWEAANAVMQMLLPVGILNLLKMMLPDLEGEKHFYLFISLFASLLFMDLDVIGYSAFWMTGSIFYLWSTVAGIWAAAPFVRLVFHPEKQSKIPFLYALPCGLTAAMGLEQIAAVVISFGMISVVYHFIKEKKIAYLHLIQIVLMAAALVVLFIAPGTAIRNEAEINTWLPQYAGMSVGQHIFMTLQWLLSALANESKLYFIMIWLVAIYILRKRRDAAGRILAAAAAVFTLAAALPYAGIEFFSEMGIGVTDISQTVLKVTGFRDLSRQNIIAMGWWSLAFLFTLIMLWFCFTADRDRVTALLLLLAAFASAAIMLFSPTIYASGERVLFVTEVLFWILLVWLFGTIGELQVKKWGTLFFAAVSLISLLSQSGYLLGFLNLF